MPVLIKISCIFVLFLFVLQPPQVSGADQVCKRLTVTGHAESPPYMWRKGEQIDGAFIDAVRLISRELGIELSIQYGGHWKRVQARVEKGEIDLIAGIYKNPAREKIYDYTIDMVTDQVVVVSLADSNLNYSGEWAQLIPYRGANVLGESQGEKLDRYMAGTLSMQRPTSLESMLNLLAYGRIDYAVHGTNAIRTFLISQRLEDKFQVHPVPLAGELMYMAFSKKSKCRYLVDQYSQAIMNLRQSGMMDSFIQKNWEKWRIENKVPLSNQN